MFEPVPESDPENANRKEDSKIDDRRFGNVVAVDSLGQEIKQDESILFADQHGVRIKSLNQTTDIIPGTETTGISLPRGNEDKELERYMDIEVEHAFDITAGASTTIKLGEIEYGLNVGFPDGSESQSVSFVPVRQTGPSAKGVRDTDIVGRWVTVPDGQTVKSPVDGSVFLSVRILPEGKKKLVVSHMHPKVDLENPIRACKLNRLRDGDFAEVVRVLEADPQFPWFEEADLVDAGTNGPHLFIASDMEAIASMSKLSPVEYKRLVKLYGEPRENEVLNTFDTERPNQAERLYLASRDYLRLVEFSNGLENLRIRELNKTHADLVQRFGDDQKVESIYRWMEQILANGSQTNTFGNILAFRTAGSSFDSVVGLINLGYGEEKLEKSMADTAKSLRSKCKELGIDGNDIFYLLEKLDRLQSSFLIKKFNFNDISEGRLVEHDIADVPERDRRELAYDTWMKVMDRATSLLKYRKEREVELFGQEITNEVLGIEEKQVNQRIVSTDTVSIPGPGRAYAETYSFAFQANRALKQDEMLDIGYEDALSSAATLMNHEIGHIRRKGERNDYEEILNTWKEAIYPVALGNERGGDQFFGHIYNSYYLKSATTEGKGGAYAIQLLLSQMKEKVAGGGYKPYTPDDIERCFLVGAYTRQLQGEVSFPGLPGIYKGIDDLCKELFEGQSFAELMSGATNADYARLVEEQQGYVQQNQELQEVGREQLEQARTVKPFTLEDFVNERVA